MYTTKKINAAQLVDAAHINKISWLPKSIVVSNKYTHSFVILFVL